MNLTPTYSNLVSPICLVIANVVPLIGVVLWQWDVASVVIFYWSENLILGALTLAKMLHKSPLGGIFMGAFFTVHYGGFCAVHGFIAMGLFGLKAGDAMQSLDWPFFFIFVELLIGVIREVISVSPPEWIWGFAALATSHTISLAINCFLRGEYKEQTLKTLMSAPYKRIVVLHLAILFGGWGVLALGSPMPVLVILVLLKTGLDLKLHVKEHGIELQNVPAAPSTPTLPPQ